MTTTRSSLSSMPKEAKKSTTSGEAERAVVRELVKAARARREDLTGPDGLLKMITATVLQAALVGQMTEHLGHEKHHPTAAGQDSNVRNGTRPRTVLTDAGGEVAIEVPEGPFRQVLAPVRAGVGRWSCQSCRRRRSAARRCGWPLPGC